MANVDIDRLRSDTGDISLFEFMIMDAEICESPKLLEAMINRLSHSNDSSVTKDRVLEMMWMKTCNNWYRLLLFIVLIAIKLSP